MKKLFCLALTTVLWSTAAFAANLAISPAAITNDYVGKITLTITGLSLDQSVKIEKFLDGNTNGVLDASDMMLQSGGVRDGRQPFIGGVRNINVPGDEDGITNGQIVVKLWYPGIEGGIDLMAGRYLLRVSDKTTGTGLATNELVIVQKPYPQGISGQVSSIGSGLPLTNTPVVLVPGNSGPITGAITDGSGNYTLYCPPGQFIVLALKPGYISDFSGGAAVSPNAFSTVNVSLPAASRIISGKLQDSITTTGIAGIFMQAQTESGQFVSTYTDSNGDYSLTVADGTWSLEPDGGQLAQSGYIGWNDGTNVTVSGSDRANVTLGCVKANALIYGRAVDSMAAPVCGLQISANDSLHVLNPRGSLFPTNGNYCLGVIGGNWNVGFDSEALQELGYAASYTNVTLTDNQAMQVNFTFLQFNAHISGRLIDNNANAVSNVNIIANTQNAQSQALTDSNGNFDLSVFGGTWQFGLSMEDAEREGLIVTTNLSVTLTNGENRSNILFMVQRTTAQICGRVQTGTGAGVNNVSVHVGLENAPLMLNTQTDGSGNFCVNVFGGNWQLAVEQNDLQSRGLLSSGSLPVTVVNGVNQNNIAIILQTVTGQINGTVQNNSAQPIANLGVWGFASLNGTNYAQYTSTDINGFFSFSACNGTWQINLDCSAQGGLQSRGYECPAIVQTNFSGGTATVNFVVHPPVPLQITTTNLTNGIVGQWYSQQLAAIGGEFPYQWCFGGAGSLPPGLLLSTNGLISGTPSNTGTYYFVARVYDISHIADTNLSITIQSAAQNRPVITEYWQAGAGEFDIVIENLTSGQYTIEVTTNVNTTGWSTLVTTNVTGNTLTIRDRAATTRNRFYRIYRP